MKYLCQILAIIILALSTKPCVDIQSNSSVHSTVSYTQHKKDHSENKDKDLCSPFCICNCCGQITLNYFPTISFDPQTAFEEIKTSNSTYTSAIYSNFYGSIWQPPQIV
ncbi:DUF6660 family protein [Flavobacterium terrisoli]|uniref:DUF6660 family protein n=1 Tax=Flavobacterium terrisoli TaxID=3242195 RepID=UPI0032ED33AD